jgi:hypothetical protein
MVWAIFPGCLWWVIMVATKFLHSCAEMEYETQGMIHACTAHFVE